MESLHLLLYMLRALDEHLSDLRCDLALQQPADPDGRNQIRLRHAIAATTAKIEELKERIGEHSDLRQKQA